MSIESAVIRSLKTVGSMLFVLLALQGKYISSKESK